MIKLPDNWRDNIVISPMHSKALFLHLKNDHDQYFTYYRTLDPAFSIDELIDIITLTVDFNTLQPYFFPDKKGEALDQNWKPAPLPGGDIMSLEQYRAIGPRHE